MFLNTRRTITSKAIADTGSATNKGRSTRASRSSTGNGRQPSCGDPKHYQRDEQQPRKHAFAVTEKPKTDNHIHRWKTLVVLMLGLMQEPVSPLEDKGDTSSTIVDSWSAVAACPATRVEEVRIIRGAGRACLHEPRCRIPQNRFDTSSTIERQQQAGGTSQGQDSRLHHSGDGRCQATRCVSVGERSARGRFIRR